MTRSVGSDPARRGPPRSDGVEDGRDLGWGRAIASGLAILLLGSVAAIYGANAIVTRMTAVSRSARQYVASAAFIAVVVMGAWVLRRLQARRLI